MPDKTTPSPQEHETLWKMLFGNRIAPLLLGGVLLVGGGIFIPLNVAVFFGMNTNPNTWLFFLDVRHWSVYVSIVLWITALWAISELVERVEDYLPLIRASAISGVLLVIFWNFRNSYYNINFQLPEHSLWFDAVFAIAICCTVRSLFLLFYCWYEKETVDFEEAVWFWGWSGILLAVLGIMGIMCIIPIEVQAGGGMVLSTTLYSNCRIGLQEFIQNGTASFALRTFAFLMIAVFIAFAYAVGKWVLIFGSGRLWGE